MDLESVLQRIFLPLRIYMAFIAIIIVLKNLACDKLFRKTSDILRNALNIVYNVIVQISWFFDVDNDD